MSTIIVITPPVRPQLADTDGDETIIKVKLEGEGSVSELLREAAYVLDGTPQE